MKKERKKERKKKEKKKERLVIIKRSKEINKIKVMLKKEWKKQTKK